ncbi:hypothetical protein NPIL_500831 [Nephila pilipes]|uniref:Uncharacterized protein n=1 Tax=Nephila pilipes TaxID=299642 RepID=A0A8X6ICW5_NEPPI|nr:hypothetical protein NPIL_500831 [Nephila pilipes]
MLQYKAAALVFFTKSYTAALVSAFAAALCVVVAGKVSKGLLSEVVPRNIELKIIASLQTKRLRQSSSFRLCLLASLELSKFLCNDFASCLPYRLLRSNVCPNPLQTLAHSSNQKLPSVCGRAKESPNNAPRCLRKSLNSHPPKLHAKKLGLLSDLSRAQILH